MAKTKEEQYHDALVYIAQVLGSGACTQNKCEGCQFEVGEAAAIAREAIGWEMPTSKEHKKGTE